MRQGFGQALKGNTVFCFRAVFNVVLEFVLRVGEDQKRSKTQLHVRTAERYSGSIENEFENSLENGTLYFLNNFQSKRTLSGE